MNGAEIGSDAVQGGGGSTSSAAEPAGAFKRQSLAAQDRSQTSREAVQAGSARRSP